MKYLAVLGRLPKLSLAELESLFTEVEPLLERGSDLRKNSQKSPALATFESSETPDINRLGGTQKLAVKLEITPLDFCEALTSGEIICELCDRFFITPLRGRAQP